MIGAPDPGDWRMPLLGATAWVVAIAALLDPARAVWAVVVVGLLTAAWLARRRVSPSAWACFGACLLVALAVLTVAGLRQTAVEVSPVSRLAAERAAVTVTGQVIGDPRVSTGRFGDVTILRLRVVQIEGRGRLHHDRAPVLVIGDPGWQEVRLGSTVEAVGRLGPSDESLSAAVFRTHGPPRVVSGPGVWWRGAEHVRRGIRTSVEHRPAAQAALVPALVTGDDAELGDDVVADFQTTGLTHLTAVSGTNLTLLLGFLLVVARWSGVRGRWLYVVALAGVAGFILLARTEPSVLRASVMGVVGLLSLGTDGRRRGARSLGVAVVVLVLIDPGLALRAGFALSVLATGGIVAFSARWADSMSRWMPPWLAHAISVPLAAQLACTPVVAAISGQVSLVAVLANLLAAPAVGPATILGLGGGLVAVVWALPAQLIGTLAGWSVGWIVWVARTGSELPSASIEWGTGPGALAALVVLCLLAAGLFPLALRHRRLGVAVVLIVLVGALLRPPSWNWPGQWVVAQCDVGQGDAIALRAGPQSAVVIDTGPDPQRVDSCLSDLGVERVPLLILTHFHADHVDGVAGVADGRNLGGVWVSPHLEPVDAVTHVRETAAAVGVSLTYPPEGVVTVGHVRLQALWPAPVTRAPNLVGGDAANDASLVVLAQVTGHSILLTGDIEPPAQEALARRIPDLDVDVLKVPHHGSPHQDHDWLASLAPEIALISVGADNTYGHPGAETVASLESAGALVVRSDLEGPTVLHARDQELIVVPQ